MNNQETIEILKNERPGCGEKIPYTEEEKCEAYDVAISAIEKQIPKKPIMKQCFDDLDDEYLCCSTCGGILTNRIPFDNKDFYFHCMNCGQKFDWSDSDRI